MSGVHSLFSCRIMSTVLAVAVTLAASSKPSSAEEIDVWIGTGGRPSLGIYHCRLDTSSGRLSQSRLVAEMGAPGFLSMHPNGRILYAIGNLGGQPVVASFSVMGQEDSPVLELTGSQPIGDGGATHLAVSKDAALLLTAQYGSGSTAVFPLDEQGNIGPRSQLLKHEGGSRVVPGRQEAPHAHWVGFSPQQRFALVPDLGLDKVLIYKIDWDTKNLTTHGFGQTPPGSGPRHMKFHPNGKWIYVLNELDLTVSLFDWSEESGEMSIRQTIPTVPKPELERLRFKSASEIRVHPNGRFVYAANRGHDSISVFSIAQDGKLSTVQNEPIRGATPRNFNLDPSGQWLLAGGQDSHTLSSFEVDSETGRLTYSTHVISTPTPICILMQHE